MKLSTTLLGVKDLNAAIAFYEALGFQRKQGGGALAFMSDGDRTLALAKPDVLEAATGRSATLGAGTLLVFLARNKADVDQTLAAARTAGATILKDAAIGAWGGYSASFTDLDGHVWAVVHNDALYRG